MRIIVEGLQTSVVVVESAIRELGYRFDDNGFFRVQAGHEIGAVRSPLGLGRPYVEIQTRYLSAVDLGSLLVEYATLSASRS